MIFLTKSKCTDGETDAQTGPSEARWLFAGGVKKWENAFNLFPHNHTF